MALSLNSVTVAGNLTRDVEARIAGSSPVASFGLAINRKYKSGDELKEEVTFLEIECWNRQAELCAQYLSKGRNVLIEGSLKYESYEDKNGNKRSSVKVSAQRVHFIGGNNEQAQAPRQPAMSATSEDDSAPF